MSYDVSILVPIYNVSQYIERCARSLFSQSYQRIEYIFVNDATTDDSVEKLWTVIREFSHREKDVKIIHHENNQGSAAARISGLKASSGTYIAMIDSDDYVEPNMIEALYHCAVRCDADIVMSDVIVECGDRSKVLVEKMPSGKSMYFESMLKGEDLTAFFWNKLIRRTLFQHPECSLVDGMNYLEDRHVMIRFFYFTEKIVHVDAAFYHYVQYNAGAITKNKGRKHFEDALLFWTLLDDFLKRHNEYEKYKDIVAKSKVDTKVRLLLDTHSSALRKEFAHIFREEEKAFMHRYKKGEKLMLCLVRHRLFTLAQLYHILSVIKNGNWESYRTRGRNIR